MDVPNAYRSTRSRVDHFEIGLQVVAAMADRCNTSATSRVVQHRRRWRTAGISISLLLSAPVSRDFFPSRFISWSFFQLPPSFSLSFFLVQCTEYALTDSIASLVPSFRYHLPPFLSSTLYPSDSF